MDLLGTRQVDPIRQSPQTIWSSFSAAARSAIVRVRQSPRHTLLLLGFCLPRNIPPDLKHGGLFRKPYIRPLYKPASLQVLRPSRRSCLSSPADFINRLCILRTVSLRKGCSRHCQTLQSHTLRQKDNPSSLRAQKIRKGFECNGPAMFWKVFHAPQNEWTQECNVRRRSRLCVLRG